MCDRPAESANPGCKLKVEIGGKITRMINSEILDNILKATLKAPRGDEHFSFFVGKVLFT